MTFRAYEGATPANDQTPGGDCVTNSELPSAWSRAPTTEWTRFSDMNEAALVRCSMERRVLPP